MTKVQTVDVVHGETECELEEHMSAVLVALTEAGLGLRCPVVYRALLAIAEAGKQIHGHGDVETTAADVLVVMELGDRALARVKALDAQVWPAPDAGKVH